MGKPRLVALAVITAVLALGASAQYSGSGNSQYSVFADLKSYRDCDMRLYEKNFLGSLGYEECSEIVECGLAQVVMIKMAQPQTPMKRLRKKIEELVVNGATPDIRYKAYLANAVFERPRIFNAEKYGTYPDGDALFSAIALRLQKTLLASK